MSFFGKIAFALAALSLGSGEAKAQSDAELLIAQYGFSFGQQFLGKVIRGGNVIRSAEKTAYEAVPSAILQYTGMKLMGMNWRLALPAQLLVQKGASIQRQSMLDRSIGEGIWTSWEIDYLWFNLRVKDGKVVLPRLNLATVFHSRDAHLYFNWRESFLSGAVIYTASIEQLSGKVKGQLSPGSFVGGRQNSHVIRMRSVQNEELLAHEIVHTLQWVRGNALFDVLLLQDASQKRFLSFLRIDLGEVPAHSVNALQDIIGDPVSWDSYFLEWEAKGYYSNR